MHTQSPLVDPFALMMHPDRVIRAMERSDLLARLQRRVCRPLDKPLLARKASDLDEYDRAIDAQAEPEEA
jgi:hypothetical protein